MVFSSPIFLFLFLPLALAFYFAAPRRLRNLVLLAASLVFYFWGERVYTLLMLFSTAANWLFGLAIDRAKEPSVRKGWLAAAVVFDLAMIGVFKYADFGASAFSAMLMGLGIVDAPLLRPGTTLGEWAFAREYLLTETGGIRLPIGISFYTFQALSYVIDVYRRDGPVQKNPLTFALYKTLFPQLIAGPIVRYKDVAAQLVHRSVTRRGFSIGVRRFVTGLGKKVLIANTVALPADRIFGLASGDLSLELAWLGIVCYTLQIYFDFSGYSDMAIGLGHMFGFRFLENFEHPYVSRSITEFWRRWHISLSNWFRDYVYVPLGGNRKGKARTYANLLIVFFLCGLWHGASWTFVAWGLYHGLFLVFERAAFAERVPRSGAWRHAYVMLVVMVGWVLFRAADFDVARHYLGALFGAAPLASGGRPLAQFADAQVVAALIAGAIGSTTWFASLAAWRERLAERSDRRALAWTAELGSVAFLACVLALSCIQLSAGTYNPFIYFRF